MPDLQAQIAETLRKITDAQRTLNDLHAEHRRLHRELRQQARKERDQKINLANMPGVGTELHKLLLRFRIRPRPGCKCTERQIAMNQNGIEWCEQNIDTIVGWMIEEAEERGRLQEAAARVFAEKLVRIAIYKAKKRM